MTARGPSKFIFLPALLFAQIGQTAFTFSPIVAINEKWMDRTLQGWLYLTLLVVEAHTFYVLRRLIRRSMPRRGSDLLVRVLVATAMLQAVFAIMSTVAGGFSDRGGRVTSLWHISSILCNIISVLCSTIIVASFIQVLCAGLNVYPCPPFDYTMLGSIFIVHMPNVTLLVLTTYYVASGALLGDSLVITILNVKIVGIMFVLAEVTKTWHHLAQLKEANRPENISFECRGSRSPHAEDIEQPESHLPTLNIRRPESVSSDYGGTNEHHTQSGKALGSQSTLWVTPQEPPRSQRGCILVPESDVYRHSDVMRSKFAARGEILQKPYRAANPSTLQRLRALRTSVMQRKSRVIGLPAHPAPLKKGKDTGPLRPVRVPRDGLLSPPVAEYTDIPLH